MIRFLYLAAGAAAPLAGPSLAMAQAPSIAAEHVWARATPPHAKNGAAYISLTSSGGDRLISAVTPVATMAEVHSDVVEGTITKMRPSEGGIALPSNTPVKLAPGGSHIMLMDLKQALTVGQQFSLTLHFAKAPPVTVTVTVRPIGAMSDTVEHP